MEAELNAGIEKVTDNDERIMRKKNNNDVEDNHLALPAGDAMNF